MQQLTCVECACARSADGETEYNRWFHFPLFQSLYTTLCDLRTTYAATNHFSGSFKINVCAHACISSCTFLRIRSTFCAFEHVLSVSFDRNVQTRDLKAYQHCCLSILYHMTANTLLVSSKICTWDSKRYYV